MTMAPMEPLLMSILSVILRSIYSSPLVCAAHCGFICINAYRMTMTDLVPWGWSLRELVRALADGTFERMSSGIFYGQFIHFIVRTYDGFIDKLIVSYL
jgi:hypothetical protein